MHPRRQAQKGGATASAGPSPERRRPDTNYDSEILHLSVDILKKAADQFQQQENINSSAVTAHPDPLARRHRRDLPARPAPPDATGRADRGERGWR